MDISLALQATTAALAGDVSNVEYAALRAASNMPLESSDFDRGIAAGIVIARLMEHEEELGLAENVSSRLLRKSLVSP